MLTWKCFWLILLTVICISNCVQNVNCEEESVSNKSVSSRNGRIMKFLNEPNQTYLPNRRIPALPARLQSRGDHFPRHPIPGNVGLTNRQSGPGPQLLRRVHNGIPNGPQRPRSQLFQSGPKATRFSPAKDLATVDGIKNNFYYSELNQIPKSGPQYPTEQYIQNFKPSSAYNGNVIVKDRPPQYTAPQQVHQTKYRPVQQYAIPEHASAPHAPENFLNHSPGYSVVPSKQTFLQQPQSNQGTTYSVYEEADQNSAPEPKIPFNPDPSHLLKTASHIISKEAQEYLRFMGSDEYFLPKRDPNYKYIDAENDRLLYQQQLQPQQQPQQAQPLTINVPASSLIDNSGSSTYEQPIQVSNLFFQQDPAPPNPNTAIVRGSYQTGKNVFVVKSDGNKAVKHIVSSPISTQGTSPPSSYKQARFNTQKSHTPEPLRFEFTEQDAISGASFTNSPEQRHQLFYKAVTSTPRTPFTSTIAATLRPVHEIEDDSEDSEDIHDTNKNALRTTAVSERTVDAKNTEEYCEKICSNVYDENDEVVCGSDGYMYTGESQLECYSSCLHINVTIKSKGSCSPI